MCLFILVVLAIVYRRKTRMGGRIMQDQAALDSMTHRASVDTILYPCTISSVDVPRNHLEEQESTCNECGQYSKEVIYDDLQNIHESGGVVESIYDDVDPKVAPHYVVTNKRETLLDGDNEDRSRVAKDQPGFVDGRSIFSRTAVMM